MKYHIICDKPNRLRVRFGKYVLTKEQCYGLSELLLSLDGVKTVNANHINGSVLIEYEKKDTKFAVLKTIKELSFKQIPIAILTQEQKAQELEAEMKKKIAMHCSCHFLKRLFLPVYLRDVYTVFRALPYIKEGLLALADKKISVEVLDATAVGASIFYKTYSTASSTMFLLKLSDLLLEYSNMRAKNALAQSLKITVDKVWLIKDDKEIEILQEDINIDDVIKIRKGSLIPVDGTIVFGDALINEATMTGEAIAVYKTINSSVFAGTVLEDGEINIRVNSLQNDSRIAKIIELIDTGEKEKASVQGKAERLADDIVPVSFGLFFLTLLLTRSLSRAISVLMVDFSCAIKLTTPITIISALKEGVNHDILVKGGKYLEVLSKVDTVVFDKTGTLTNAVPKVSKVISVHNDYSQDEVLKIAACLEEHFPHSVANAIVNYAKQKEVLHPEEHEKVEYIVAHGIASIYNGKHTIIGSKHFVFEDEKVPFSYELQIELEKEIGTDSAVYLAVDGELIGLICVDDPPRADAKATIDALKREGIKDIYMITGDALNNAKRTCELIGIDNYYAAVLPDGKAEIVEELKAKGKTILMVGDGINDTPALSMADVSLTLNGCSDIAKEVADISVISDELSKIIIARRLSKKLMQKIHNQYGFIVSFNTALIILGILGIITTNTSALMHNASTMLLTLNSTSPMIKKDEILTLTEVIEDETT